MTEPEPPPKPTETERVQAWRQIPANRKAYNERQRRLMRARRRAEKLQRIKNARTAQETDA